MKAQDVDGKAYDLVVVGGTPGGLACAVRAARAEYNEPHAGVVFTKERAKEPGQRGFPKDAATGRLKIRYNSHATGDILPESTGEADSSVMAYNYRLILTKDPTNRVMVKKPVNYDPAIAQSLPHVIGEKDETKVDNAR